MYKLVLGACLQMLISYGNWLIIDVLFDQKVYAFQMMKRKYLQIYNLQMIFNFYLIILQKYRIN